MKPDMTFAINPFKSLCVGDLFLSCVVQISYRASFCPSANDGLQCSVAYINTTSDVTVLDQVVGGQDCVVGLDDRLRDFW